MKKICKLLLVFMLFFVTSCSKEEANVENNVNDEHQIKNNHSNVLNSNEIGDIIAIDGLKEINISDINIFDSKYYRNGLNINLNENLLNKKITISLENGSPKLLTKALPLNGRKNAVQFITIVSLPINDLSCDKASLKSFLSSSESHSNAFLNLFFLYLLAAISII